MSRSILRKGRRGPRASRESSFGKNDIGFYYVIDKEGVIFWNFLSPVEVNPGADGILAALDRLQK